MYLIFIFIFTLFSSPAYSMDQSSQSLKFEITKTPISKPLAGERLIFKTTLAQQNVANILLHPHPDYADWCAFYGEKKCYAYNLATITHQNQWSPIQMVNIGQYDDHDTQYHTFAWHPKKLEAVVSYNNTQDTKCDYFVIDPKKSQVSHPASSEIRFSDSKKPSLLAIDTDKRKPIEVYRQTCYLPDGAINRQDGSYEKAKALWYYKKMVCIIQNRGKQDWLTYPLTEDGELSLNLHTMVGYPHIPTCPQYAPALRDNKFAALPEKNAPFIYYINTKHAQYIPTGTHINYSHMQWATRTVLALLGTHRDNNNNSLITLFDDVKKTIKDIQLDHRAESFSINTEYLVTTTKDRSTKIYQWKNGVQ